MATVQLPKTAARSAEKVVLSDARANDIEAVLSIHEKAFRGFFMTELGPRFLRVYYRTVLEFPGCIFRVASIGGKTVGFAAGFADPPAFYAALRAKRLNAALAIAARLLSKPSLLKRVLLNYGRAGTNAASEGHDGAELASIAVLPEASGLSIGRRLVEDFIRVARDRNARSVKLSTDARDNDRVNHMYLKCGFRFYGQLTVQDRILNEYIYDLPKRPAEC